MPYLSDAWSIPEVVCWVVARDPNSLMAAPGNIREIALLASNHLHTGKALTRNALDDVILAILSGRISARARNVQTGQIQLIPARELNALEFHVATDIPGSPFGFRGVADQVLKWVSPMVSAADALACWPKHQAARTAVSTR